MNVEMNFEKRYRLIREIIETVVLTALMFLIINMAIQNFDVDGPSMEESLHHQERVMVDKWSYLFHAPARGDVIVFIAPPEPKFDYVKRIVAVPGDVVTVDDTKITVNGVALDETYISPKHQGYNGKIEYKNTVVPADTYFVLGDNRRVSSDSRSWGWLPRKNIIGRVSMIYLPLGKDNIGLLPNVSSVYAKVPTPDKTKEGSTSGPLLSNSPPFNDDLALTAAVPLLFAASARVRFRR